MRNRLLVSVMTFLVAGALSAQDWLPTTIPGAKNPAEIAGRYRNVDFEHLNYFVGQLFTISENESAEGTELWFTSYRVDDPSTAVTTRIPTLTPYVFGLSHKIAYSSDDAAYVAYIDGGQVMALRSTDNGETWTSSTVATSRSYGETQISFTSLGVMIAAYNFQLRQIELFRFVQATLVWNSVGTLLGGRALGIIDGAPRMTFDGDERKDDIMLGWSELFDGGKSQFVGRFALPSLQPIGSTVRNPVVYRTGAGEEVQMARVGDYVAALSAVGGRWTLSTFNYKQDQPNVTLYDLGPERPNTIGGVALMEGGERSLYTATATPDGDIDFRQYEFDSMGRGEMRSLPPIRGAHTDPAETILPYSLNIMGMGAQMRLRHHYPGSLRVAEFTGCVDSRRRLCSTAHRFDVSVNWRDPQGNSGFGRAIPLTSDTGYFWFFNDANIELVIKILNGCTVNQRFWVFAGGLTDVEVDITVRDTQTGAVKTYRNPLGTAFQPVQDTSAFAGCSAGTSLALESPPLALPLNGPAPWSVQGQQGPCVPSETALCVNGGRFRVEASWRTSGGATGTGKAIPLTADSGYFWFFAPNAVELLTKVLNACIAPFNHHWVFAAGLTNVEVEMVVTDVATGAVKRYTNPQGTAFQPILDTSAFPACP